MPRAIAEISICRGPTLLRVQLPCNHATVRLAVPLSVSATEGARGFSFRDASIGAAVAVAAMIVLATSLVVRRRRVVQAL
jgi:hypothetical protein